MSVLVRGIRRATSDPALASMGIPAFLRRNILGREDRPALIQNRCQDWVAIPYCELWERVDRVAAAFERMGVGRGDHVAILMRNRPEWIIADLALLSIGAVDVPLYPSYSPAQVRAILADAECDGIVVGGGECARRLAAAAPRIRWAVGVDERAPSASAGDCFEWRELASDEAGERGDTGPAPEPARPSGKAPEAGDLATIIYTSGTTGAPRGVMLTHGNIVSNLRGIIQALPLGPEDVFLSFLPLSHVFERTGGHYVPLAIGASVAYAESPDSVGANLAEIRPTVVAAVPRFFEKTRDRMLEAIDELSGTRRAMVSLAFRIGVHHAEDLRRSDPPEPRALLHRAADRLVFRAIRQRLGGRLRFFVSGGAALAPDLENFFWAAGIPVLQGYGLTETSPVTSVNLPGASRAGTVGPAIPGVEIRTSGDGEILVRGPNVMKGYWKRPEETAAVIDTDGWLHTGDLGTLDGDGYLRITGRKRDMIVLTTGKNVSPEDVEPVVVSAPLISQVLVIGEGRPFVGALVVPDFGRLAVEFHDLPGDPAAREAAFAADPRIGKRIGEEIAEAQASLAPYQRVRRFRMLGREFSLDEEEITPTLKLRRASILRRRAATVDAVFSDQPGTWTVPDTRSGR